MGYCCFKRPALQVRVIKKAPVKVEYVQRLTYYKSEYKNQFVQQPTIGDWNFKNLPKKNDIVEYVKREVPLNNPNKSYQVEKTPPVGVNAGKDYCAEVKKEKIIDKNEESKEGEAIRYGVDDKDKNWALMENRNH